MRNHHRLLLFIPSTTFKTATKNKQGKKLTNDEMCDMQKKKAIFHYVLSDLISFDRQTMHVYTRFYLFTFYV